MKPENHAVDYNNLDDATLVRLVGHAHADALSELYDRYHGLVFSLARNVVGDDAAAEEITLDVFTRVWENARSYRLDQAKVSTWLLSIARHRAIDVLRRQRARPQHNSMAWSEVWPEPAAKTAEPEEATDLALEQQRVRRAVAELPPEQRQVLALAYFKGYTHREIAAALREPLGTIKTRLRLAMQKLRKHLKAEEDD